MPLKAKQLLLKELCDAFSGDDEMSLLASLGDLTQEEASWRINDTTWTIQEILYHVAACEIEYCKQGFGLGLEYGKPSGDVGQMLKLLDQAHAHLVGCLEALPEEELDKPIPIEWHGESTAHFFWIMVMHRVSHAAQIRTIRRAYGSRTDYYPIS
ncbi:MAG: DinB family protein [Anaerolineae bacterium]|nr:DinB family protein [Anaerolineae bacterium]